MTSKELADRIAKMDAEDRAQFEQSMEAMQREVGDEEPLLRDDERPDVDLDFVARHAIEVSENAMTAALMSVACGEEMEEVAA